MRQAGFLVVLLAQPSGTAVAASGDDVTLSRLGSWGNVPADPALALEAYHTVVNELGIAIANKPVGSAGTLGINGFDVGLSSSIAFVSSHDESPTKPSPWSRVDPTGEPAPVLWIPWIHARKGLPLSLEVGANLGYLAFTHQTALGGFARWGLVEGYSPVPDISIQIGYAGYVGNDELELGVMDVSGTVGYTLPFGSVVGINHSRFSPYIGVGRNRVHAAPRLPEAQQADIGITSVSGFQSSKAYDPAFEHTTVDAGICIWSSDFELNVAATWTPDTLVTVTGGFGWTY